ncbi:MAG: hypothetical protein C9356_02695 [Oleiphilus sp.]|nr:MAG: hypothetical protein C9356_02695 [Oleiphilus sp.]
MNIEGLSRAVRRAKKLRPALVFHSRQVHGIDVPHDKEQFVFSFIKMLFKRLKAKDFNIQVSPWGEILLTAPIHDIPLTISVAYFPKSGNVEKTFKPYGTPTSPIKFHMNAFQPELQLRFRVLRNSTKWQSFPIQCSIPPSVEQTEHIVEQMLLRCAGLLPNPDLNKPPDVNDVEIADVLALVRYCAAMNGETSGLYSLVRSDFMMYPNAIVIEDKRLTFVKSECRYAERLLQKNEHKVFKLFFGALLEKRIEVRIDR